MGITLSQRQCAQLQQSLDSLLVTGKHIFKDILFIQYLEFADFNTVGLISAYFAWRRGRGRSRMGRYGNWSVLGALVCPWIASVSLIVIPLLGVYGGIGFSAVHGKCQITPLDEDTIISHAGGVIFTVGTVGPFIVMLVSYGLVYKSLYENMASDEESYKKQQAVFMYIFCYAIFIIPYPIIELLSDDIDNKEIISLSFFCWHCLIYILNPFLYGFSDMRIRTATTFMFKDLLGLAGSDEETRSNLSDPWWQELQSTTVTSDLSTDNCEQCQ